MKQRLVLVACFLLALLWGSRASSQDAALDRAKELFRQGNELRKAGDCGRALALYLESRSLVPSAANTTNSAVCMAELGRDDEALDMYEELLVKFRSDLSDDETRALAEAMANLRHKLGRVDLSSNVKGLVVIDGRKRGQLPLTAPIHVLPGTHVLRVLAEGYETFEEKISVEMGGVVAIDAKLVPLAHAGRLRLELPSADDGAEIVVDGAVIGRAPWEGTLTPGPHVLVVRHGPRGTAPMRAVIIENQTVILRAALAVLGPELRVVPDPPSAQLWIDTVSVGPGEWRGALPIGRHVLEAREEAYLPREIVLDVTEAPMDAVVMRLERDPANPKWATKRTDRLWVEISGAFALAGGLGSGAEASCDHVACGAQKLALGGSFAARVGYVLPAGVSLHVGGGYLALRTTLTRRIDSAFATTGGQVPTSYDLKDTIDFSGPFASVGVGAALPLTRTLEVGARADLGLVLASASDAVTGTITGGGRTLELAIQDSGSSTHGAAPFVLPELFARARWGRFYVGASAALGIFFVSGPSLGTGEAGPRSFDCTAHPNSADCAPRSNLLRGERAFGPAVIWLPGVQLGAMF